MHPNLQEIEARDWFASEEIEAQSFVYILINNNNKYEFFSLFSLFLFFRSLVG